MSSMDSVTQWWQKKRGNLFSGSPSGSDQTTSTLQRNEKRNKTFFALHTGNTLNSHEYFIDRLNKRVRLQQVFTVAECDFILVFCPVVSRAGTDIEAALKKLNHESDTKPAVLMVLHHTFDPDCVVPDSSRVVHRTNTITVDCLFHEDEGLLQCHKNDESLTKTLEYINPHSTVKTEKQLDTRTNTHEALLDENRELKKMIFILEQQLAEKNHQPLAKTPQAQQNLLTVDPGAVERMTNKAEESDNAQHKPDQQLISNYEHLQKKQRLMERMKERVEERHKEVDMESEQLEELIQYEEMSNRIISKRDSELAETRAKLKKAEHQIEKKISQLENRDKLLSDKETQLKKTKNELESSKSERDTLGQELQDKTRQLQEMMIVQKQQKTELAEKNKQFEEKERLLTERETQLMERDKQLQEKDKLLTEYTQKLQMKDKTLQENETLLREVIEELGKTKSTCMLEENQTQLKKKENKLESVMNELQTVKKEIIDKDKQLQEKDRILADDIQVKKEKEVGADTGIGKSNVSTCYMQVENKSQSKDQQPGEIKREMENTNEEVENNENSTHDTGTLFKDAIEKLQNTAKEPQERKEALHETDEQPEPNNTQKPPINEKKEHQNNKDAHQTRKDSDRNSTENKHQLKQHKSTLTESQTPHHEDTDSPQLAKEKDTHPSEVKDQ